MEQKKNNKKLYWSIAILIAFVAVFITVFFIFRPKPIEGEKAITIEVIDNNQKSTLYNVNTDAEFLLGAMEDTENLTFNGTEGEYGLMIEVVNGLSAVYDKDGAFWGFNVNGEFCQYGVTEQPVADGDAFQIIYTLAQ